MSAAFHATDRTVLSLAGADARDFLQGLISNDMERLEDGGILYAALLSPQGKYLFDFFVVGHGDGFMIDVKADRGEALAQRLNLYRLRAKVELAGSDVAVVLGNGDLPPGAVADSRSPGLGWRAYVADPAAFTVGMEALSADAWQARRIALGVPETGVELVPDDAYILEMGFERLGGVDFRKGCFVGQEVTARMKHKTELRKGLVKVNVEGPAPMPGTPVLASGKPAGTLYSVAEGAGLAHLRFDRAEGEMIAGAARITRRAE